MATCSDCKQEMTTAVGCLPVGDTYSDFADGIARARIPYDTDGLHGRNCHDCRVQPGQLHHPGCDVERCPRCMGQAISCECTSTGERDDD